MLMIDILRDTQKKKRGYDCFPMQHVVNAVERIDILLVILRLVSEKKGMSWIKKDLFLKYKRTEHPVRGDKKLHVSADSL